MNLWTIAIIAVGLIAITGVVVANVSANEANETEIQQPKSCSASCGNSCSVERNCGLESCGAVTGGSCGCS